MSENKESATYDAGCHCGYIRFSATLSPPLPEYEIVNCNCSMCTRAGYLLIYPDYENVTWHNDSKARCSKYAFNTKTKDQLFCPKCGTSIGIDFCQANPKFYGISARTLYNVDLDSLKYKKLDGKNLVEPKGDLSGMVHKET